LVDAWNAGSDMNDDDCAPPSHRGALPEGAAEVTIGGATLAMRAFGGSFFNEHGHVPFTEPANSPFWTDRSHVAYHEHRWRVTPKRSAGRVRVGRARTLRLDLVGR
jgi:hypothetical protein